MKSAARFIALFAIALAAFLVLIETLYFASLRPGYSHLANTISELGETGAPEASAVAFGFFLPVGLLVWLALWLSFRESVAAIGKSPPIFLRSSNESSAEAKQKLWHDERALPLALILLSNLGTGYVVAAFFPCDPGGPIFGTWRTLIHNVAGFIDYAGTGFGFLLIARQFVKQGATFQSVTFATAGAIVLICLSLLMTEHAFRFRGAVQRVAEFAQFAGVFLVCSQKRSRNGSF